MVHSDDGDDDGDEVDSDVLHNSILVPDPSKSPVHAARNCLTSMEGVADLLTSEGHELADTSL